jgi:hypothetical protein
MYYEAHADGENEVSRRIYFLGVVYIYYPIWPNKIVKLHILPILHVLPLTIGNVCNSVKLSNLFIYVIILQYKGQL